MDGPRILSISELTSLIKNELEQPIFKNIAVEGEISNFIHHTSGHMYFSLKDKNSKVKAVMFRGRNMRLNFIPKNGDTVVAIGSLGVYEPNGEYQLYIDQMFPQGVGALHIQFEELKNKLQQEGLFDYERKRPLPTLPSHVAVITSPTGAAIRDILSVIGRRFPKMNVLVIPAIVQGVEGPPSIVQAFEFAAQQSDLDVIILARGGGSLEELWAFNDERVARAIAQCPIPVVTGVGHETDFTIADFVSDCRAPTPSAAAELVVPDYFELQRTVQGYYQRLLVNIENLIANKKTSLSYLTNRGALLRPQDKLNRERQRVDELLSRTYRQIEYHQDRFKQQLRVLSGKLDTLSPLATLSRGYSICSKNGQVIVDANQVEIGDHVTVRLRKSQLSCIVEKREEVDY